MLTLIAHVACGVGLAVLLVAALAGETTLAVRRRLDAPRITKEISAAATQYVLNQRAALLSTYLHPEDKAFLESHGWQPPETRKAVIPPAEPTYDGAVRDASGPGVSGDIIYPALSAARKQQIRDQVRETKVQEILRRHPGSHCPCIACQR